MEPFLGQITMFGGNFAPRGWATCDGQLLPISQNTALFSLLGTMYGGDGRTTFGLPDLRSRVAIGQGTGPGLSNHRLGESSGVEKITLSENNIPTLVGTIKASTATRGGASNSPENNYLATGGTYNSGTNVTMAIDSVTIPGDAQPISIASPSLSVNYIIALQGTFPSRS